MNARVHVYISGFVQGVFFRSETRAKALRLGLKGWVRNLSDGRVEAVFEGGEEGVKDMIEFCKVGPPGAVVRDVEVIWEEYWGEFKSFEIKYGWE